jgi:hypothetical protein
VFDAIIEAIKLARDARPKRWSNVVFEELVAYGGW